MSNEKLIEPPHEIICYALKVGDWFKERNITHWKLADCASRDALELADKRIAELEADLNEWKRCRDAVLRDLTSAQYKLAVAREALKKAGHTNECRARCCKGGDEWIDETKCDCCIGEALAQIGEKS